MEAGLSGGVHPGIDGVSTDSIFSGDLGNLSAGPGFLDDSKFGLRGGMNVGHIGTNKITKMEVCQEKSVGELKKINRGSSRGRAMVGCLGYETGNEKG